MSDGLTPVQRELMIEDRVKSLLTLLGHDLEHPDLERTPERVARWLIEMGNDPAQQLAHVIDILKSTAFPSKYDEMILVKDIQATGLCPHHFLPVEYCVHVGYIPNEEVRTVVGLSKIPRAVIELAKCPDLQENFTGAIAFAFGEAISPMGFGVVVTGRHACMRCRGVKQDTPAITSVMTGALRDTPIARTEFLRLINHG